LFGEVGQLHCRGECYAFVVHKVEQFGNKVGKADIALYLSAAFFLAYHVRTFQLPDKLSGS